MYTLHTITKSYTIPSNFTGIVEYSDGTKQWLDNGKCHRLGGPAYIDSKGNKWWIQYGESHRIGGPAYEGVDRTKEWWVDGKLLTESEHKIYVENLNKKSVTCDGRQIEIDGKKYKLILID